MFSTILVPLDGSDRRGTHSCPCVESVASETLRKLTVPVLLVRPVEDSDDVPVVLSDRERSMA